MGWGKLSFHGFMGFGVMEHYFAFRNHETKALRSHDSKKKTTEVTRDVTELITDLLGIAFSKLKAIKLRILDLPCYILFFLVSATY